MTIKKNKPTLMERFNNARMLWLTVGSLFIGSGSVIAKGKDIISFLAQDTITEAVTKVEEKMDKKLQTVLVSLKEDRNEQQVELLMLLSEAIPEVKTAVKKRLEQRKASDLLREAMEGQ